MDPLHYSMGSDRVLVDVPIKRIPENDEDFFDLDRPSYKRQAVGGTAYHRQPAPMSTAPDVTVQGLRDKAPGELVSIILQMQSSHEQQVARLQNQYAVVNRQLEQLTAVLNTHFTSQLNAIQSVQQVSVPRPTVQHPRENTSICGPASQNFIPK